MELRLPWLETHLQRLLIFRDLTFKMSFTTEPCLYGAEFRLDVDDKYFSQKGFSMENFQPLLRRVNRLQSLLNRCPNIVSIFFSLRNYPPSLRTVFVDCQTEQSPSEDLSVDSYAVVAAAAVLLSLVYHYLTGHAARGGSIPYSSGSLDFRDTYIPIILFHGAYVWIKSRAVAHKGVYRREIPDKRGNIRVVYEPRFKPSHRKGEPSQHIYVGQYATPEEALILYQITAVCYNGQGGLLQLEDGDSVTIPAMTDSGRRLTAAEKRKCVGAQVRRVYKAFKAERANAAQHGELQAGGGGHTNSVCLNSADTRNGAPLPVNPTQNSETGIAPCGNHGLDSLCEMCIVGLGFTPRDGVDTVDAQAFRDANNFQEGVAASNTQSGTSFSSENELVLLRSLVSSQQEVISLQRQQLQEISEARHQQYIEQQQRDIELQELKAELTELRNHQYFQPLEPQAFSIQHFQPFQDQLQVIDQASVDHSSNDLFRYFMNA